MVKLPKRAYKPSGLGRYGGARFNRYSRRSTRARRSAKIRKARSKARVAKRGYVDRVVTKAIKNKRNHIIQTHHRYRIDQDLTYRNAYFPLGTRDQSAVTDDPGVGNGAAIPYTEANRLEYQHGVSSRTYKDVIGKGIKLHRMVFKGHVYIDPQEWMQNVGKDHQSYLDIFIFLAIDRKQKDTQVGYAANASVQNQSLRLTDFLVDRTQTYDTAPSMPYDPEQDALTEWKGHYMQTLRPINTKRYKILKFLKFRMNPGQVIKSGSSTYAFSDISISFPGRPSYANSNGFDMPFEMTYIPKGGKHLSYAHNLVPHSGSSELQDSTDPNYWATNANKQMGGNDTILSNTICPHVQSHKNFYGDAPKNFNPFLACCYSRATPQTALTDSEATGLATIEYNCQVIYENPLHD